jgi:hypothetical protein
MKRGENRELMIKFGYMRKEGTEGWEELHTYE